MRSRAHVASQPVGEPVPLCATAAFDTPTEIDEAIFWLRVRLPFALDHVNLWLCDDGDGWTVIDTGYGDLATRAVWQGLLAGMLGDRPVKRVLVTHFHPDHMGQAGWLCGETGAALWMSRTEWLTGRMLALDATDAFVAETERFYRRSGLYESVVLKQSQRGNTYRRGVSQPPASFTRLAAGDQVTMAGSSWQVLIGEGHAPEQVTLYCEERRLLIAADQILPRISPVIGVWPSQPEADPLSDLLRSLEQYRYLPGECRVLPSHGIPFLGLHARLEQLVAHHEQRLDMTLAACALPATAADVMRTLFTRELDAHQTGFALSETLAHLNFLIGQNLIECQPDQDGVVLFYRKC